MDATLSNHAYERNCRYLYCLMVKNSLFQQNPYLRDQKNYDAALRLNVVSSVAIEGVKKAAEKALSLNIVTTAKH